MNNILSLFDGISAGQIALSKLNIRYNKYYASEIDKKSIEVTQCRFPDTVQLGDVRKIDGNVLHNIKLIMGGSPCTDLTIMGAKKGMVTKNNIEVTDLNTYLKLKNEGFEFHGESYLFWEFVRLYKETNAKYFLLENVIMNKKWEKVITKALGVDPIRINSSLLSAQNRDRLYWTNIPNVTIPKDKGITISDVIPDALYAAGIRGVKVKGIQKPDGRFYYKGHLTYRFDGKSNCVVSSPGTTGLYLNKDLNITRITPEEAEMLQTIDTGYTNVDGISESRRFKMIGNSWTVDVITHIFKNLITKKNRYNLFFR